MRGTAENAGAACCAGPCGSAYGEIVFDSAARGGFSDPAGRGRVPGRVVAGFVLDKNARAASGFVLGRAFRPDPGRHAAGRLAALARGTASPLRAAGYADGGAGIPAGAGQPSVLDGGPGAQKKTWRKPGAAAGKAWRGGETFHLRCGSCGRHGTARREAFFATAFCRGGTASAEGRWRPCRPRKCAGPSWR